MPHPISHTHSYIGCHTCRLRLALLVLWVATMSSACLDRTLKPINPCLVSGVNAEVSVSNINNVDLLFMVDDSSSMKEEQQALSAQFKNIITVLTTGKQGHGKPDFSPAKNLHLAVVSSDLGTPGVPPNGACMGSGDDGVMQNAGRLPGCQASYPRFLTYSIDANTPQQTADDFACIAALGTDGCGFEQQLESTLKALWPSVDPMPLPDGTNRVKFVVDTDGFGALGHGDTDNAGFLRDDPRSPSLLAIVLVTDEDDCSATDPTLFAPASLLNKDDPKQAALAGQGLNVRCALNPDLLFETRRYVQAFKALRPGNENLVIFAAITGVPPETVNEQVLAATDFKDETSREQFYQRILNDPNMQPVIDDMGNDEPLDDQLRDSCKSANGLAYPPRRIVEVAREFGENAIVQSICQDDFEPAIAAIIQLIGNNLGAVCLPRPLVPNRDGLVACNVLWELPTAEKAPDGTPTTCTDPRFPFLLAPAPGEKIVSQAGGARCRVPQLAVQGGAVDKHVVPTETDGVMFADGWFYDDFTQEVHDNCDQRMQPQRIAFTAEASPPSGVTVKLECVNETQHLAQQRNDLLPGTDAPAVGDACGGGEQPGSAPAGDAACALRLASGQVDTSMFCHAGLQVCVQSCSSDADCPAAWVCDQRPESLEASGGRAFCVNPTCGDAK